MFDDLKWGITVLRARRMRRRMLFSQRMKFDEYARPRTSDGAVIAYPDAFYHLTAKTVNGAIKRMRNDANIDAMLGS
jgi:hypothetical protein